MTIAGREVDLARRGLVECAWLATVGIAWVLVRLGARWAVHDDALPE